MDLSRDFWTSKTALVCGASQGIGFATAYELARRGCQVIGVARSQQALSAASRQWPGSGHRLLALDLSQLAEVRAHISPIASQTPIHIVVNNGGGPPPGPITEASSEQFLQAFTAHVLAAQTIAQLVLPQMKEQRFGRIINVISTSVKVPLPNLGVSNTIRAAMASWAKTWAMEVAPYGITVNNVLPGFIKTARLQGLLEGAAQKSSKPVDDLAQQWMETVPARRFGEPEEMAAAIAFLASAEASYINGIHLPVDGGRTGAL